MCADCGANPKRVRGLCEGCYHRHRRAGTHLDFPAVYRSREDTLADYGLLRSEGYTSRQCAERLGMGYSALRKALWRARTGSTA